MTLEGTYEHQPNHAWGCDWLIYVEQCLSAQAGPWNPQGQVSHCLLLEQSYTHTQCVSVMSTNIRIVEYSNKMALKYYSYSYSCHFPSTNIFRYSFVDFWTTEYIRIFVRKFSKIRLYLNICSEPYFNIQLSIFNEKRKSRYNLCIQNIQCIILFRGNISEYFLKISSIRDEYEYKNIKIKWPSNIIRIRIRAISGIQIYSDICLVNMLHPNLFRYSFGT